MNDIGECRLDRPNQPAEIVLGTSKLGEDFRTDGFVRGKNNFTRGAFLAE